ncbi:MULTISPECIES: hypothetical protein [Lysinibacillus]|uniref:hypothetical protein n=1 Tax=Lysinibacillus TaxID=400634 RepID=UPI00214CEE93|nr:MULTISPECIES: hypothetical protein [Lysinibacillus]UUV23852.1 hypothetical protein NP781_18895 [Lysinibacillus sp. FN11]UYB46724.1 hypothetical protein OCI51_21505 [Lysinibacillus capsici]WHP40756.1 hypothetical protein QIX46_19720 [Lysinibacillus boronitolerans]
MIVNQMDKYELTNFMKEVKEYITKQGVYFSHLTKDDFEEILNPPTDKDGYVQKYYLSESTKVLVEMVSELIRRKSRSS